MKKNHNTCNSNADIVTGNRNRSQIRFCKQFCLEQLLESEKRGRHPSFGRESVPRKSHWEKLEVSNLFKIICWLLRKHPLGQVCILFLH
jgi:hypothetical protein